MIERKIQLVSIEDIKKFVTASNMAPFDSDLTAERFVVDAKSILGIFSLNLSQPITLKIHADDGAEVQAFLDAIASYIVE